MEKLTFLEEKENVFHWQFLDDGSPIQNPPRTERQHINSLIISDTHFGSTACKARALHATLNTFWITENLILNGDAFQGSDLKPVSEAQQKVIERIRKLGDLNSHTHVNDIWVRGNHDERVVKLFSSWFGLSVCTEYLWECGGKRYLAIHGDQWDRFISDRSLLMQVAVWMHELIQKIDPQNRHIIRFFSNMAGRWRHEHERVARGAAHYGKEKGVDYIICGHTHRAMERTIDTIGYLNCGCWVQDPCSFVTVTQQGPRLNIVHLS